MSCENADVPAVLLSQTDAEAAVFCLINEQRVANGVPALTLNTILRSVARDQAMAAAAIKWWPPGEAGHVPHVNPVTHKDEQVRIEEAGYCPINSHLVPRNENAYAYNFKGDPGVYGVLTTPAAAVDWWMGSPPHRTTLLDPTYGETGVGVVRGTASPGLPPDEDGAIFLQTFGGCSEPEPAVDTQLWAWGGNVYGQLGDGTGEIGQSLPVHPAEYEDFVTVAASHHSLAVKSDGTVLTWGPRHNKGTSPSGGSPVPVKVPFLDQVVSIAAGYEHDLAIRMDGTAWAWGSNAFGKLGDGSFVSTETPVQVHGLQGVKAVAAGRDHSLALLYDGSVWGWGNNDHGQLGTHGYGTSPPPALPPLSATPIRISGLPVRISAIAVGENHCLAIEETTGQLWVWGSGIAGCLGTGHAGGEDVLTPTRPVPSGGFNGDRIVSVDAGFDTSYAVDDSGRVWAWGENGFQQFGTGTSSTLQSAYAQQVLGLSDVVSISAGEYHCMAVKRDGTIWSWGANANGQLGQGTTGVTDLGRVALDHPGSFSGGSGHSLAIAHQAG